MIQTATVYMTSDKRHFFSAKEAEEHEAIIKAEREITEVVESLSKNEQIRGHMRKAILAWMAR